MKIVQINTFPYKATGSIMMNIHNELLNENIDSYVIWGRGRKEKNNYEYKMSNKLSVYIHGLYTRFTDKTGFLSYIDTKKMIKKLNKINPDIIHLHNIHGYYINIKMLFKYIKSNNIKVIWTFHDCWPFTGHCAYFDMVNCNKWMKECYKCPQINTYPKSIVDNSKWNYNMKKEIFNYDNLTIVTPCKWLSELVKKSFFKNNDVEVIYNGIDKNIFKYTNNKYFKTNKKIILGVASEWTERKGLKDFIKLDKILNHNKYQIVLVGIDEKTKKNIPNSIITISRTNNVNELVNIYSSAFVFFNPTYEDNFPTTNLEAMACNTPVITYNTGGSPESIENNGFVIEKGNYEEVINILEKINIKVKYNNVFTKENMIKNYIELYKKINKKGEKI